MTEIATGGVTLKWDVFVTKREGLTRDLPPGKEQWMWVPTSATLIYGEREHSPSSTASSSTSSGSASSRSLLISDREG